MDPTPAPSLSPAVDIARAAAIFSENAVEVALLIVLGLIVVLGLVIILVWAIYRSAQFQPQAMLVIVLGVLALVASIGYFVGGDDRAELITLAAAAVGALAGALTMMTQAFTKSSEEQERESDAKKEVDSASSQETRSTPPRLGSPAGQADSQEEVGRSSQAEGEGGTTSETSEDPQEDAEEEEVK